MVIDIISYTDEQLAELSEEQILEVKKVQQQKDRLKRKLDEAERKEKYRLIKAGIFRSPVWQLRKAEMEEGYLAEVEELRDGLLFYLRFSARGPEAPYPLDYGLTFEERLKQVREYYDTTYSDPNEKFLAFRADKTARNYLGEYYAPLYELYAAQR